jgi:hypothetical protein
MAERQPSSHAQWANTTLAPGFWVAVTLRPGAAPLRVYVGRVQAVDERGLRLTLVDWSTGGADSWDVYAPWSEVTSMLIATADHATEGFGDAAQEWQERMQERMQGARPDEQR